MKKKIFIGFDSAQAISYDVLAYSIRRHAPADCEIIPLKLKELEAKGFKRAHDPLQSTEFTYTRFLVPWLCHYKGIALFLDSDMLALGNLLELFKLDMEPYALRVVKHDYQPTDKTKMGGKTQTSYPRKNWSSLFLADCAKLRCWTKDAVETQSGAWLHRFEPIPDAQIGEIDGTHWNVLDRYDEKTKLIHYTEGGPWLRGCENHPYGDIWMKYQDDYLKSV
jgi:lipopolysaccharide biosynthesis glycosyltransferase